MEGTHGADTANDVGQQPYQRVLDRMRGLSQKGLDTFEGADSVGRYEDMLLSLLEAYLPYLSLLCLIGVALISRPQGIFKPHTCIGYLSQGYCSVGPHFWHLSHKSIRVMLKVP